MRPAGEIRQALLSAASLHYTSAGHGATLKELAHRACVGMADARICASNLKRAGALAIVGERRVEYRNRPVAEYAPAEALQDASSSQPWVDLNQCMADWVR